MPALKSPTTRQSAKFAAGGRRPLELARIGGGDEFDAHGLPSERASALDPAIEMMAFFRCRSLRV